MDRRVDVKINGTHLSKDTNRAGVRGEANVTCLRITFDAGWKGYAKKVTFWDARGKHPVTIPLTADRLEDITSNIDTYLCPIPGEALTEGGLLTFIVDGYTDGKRQRSVSDNLEVIPAPLTEGSGDAQDPTPSEAERLQVQIDSILDIIEKDLVGASEHAANAATSEMNAAEYARQAQESADDALASENAAAGHAAAAQAAAANNHRGEQIYPSQIELTPVAGANHGGFIDFHYGGAEVDHTSRIMETNYGVINVFATLQEFGSRVYSPANKPTPSEIGAIQRGGVPGQLNNPINIGWSTDRGLRVSIDATDVGSIPLTGASDNVVLPVEKGGTGVRSLVELRDALKAIW